jgi:hypothetical protein
VPERIAIQFREGGHSHTLQDWTAMLDFMDAVWRWRWQVRPPKLVV